MRHRKADITVVSVIRVVVEVVFIINRIFQINAIREHDGLFTLYRVVVFVKNGHQPQQQDLTTHLI